MPGIYESVRALKVARNAFDLSYEKKLTCDMGQLIPIMCEEAVPGDTFKLAWEVVVRSMPQVVPILHEVNVFIHAWFVPNRHLDANWESFITGGLDGADASTMARWTPTSGNVTNDNGVVTHDNGPHSLWDYLGFPVTDAGIVPTGALPLAFPRAAYNHIWNNFYRDETQDAAVALTSNIVLNRRWEKDFFTSALPWQQRGTAPALPISGVIAVAGVNADITVKNASDATTRTVQTTSGASALSQTTTPSATGNMRWVTPSLQVDVGGATTFNVSDLRLVFQIQKWMERNARGGARYVEFILSHFGVRVPDYRLQRPEYIGGMRMPMIMSEVLCTSADGTNPVGGMAGHGLAVGRDYAGSYRVTEHGWIMAIMSIMPRSAYHQGIDRQFLRTTRYDWYSPEWAHLSEQAVIRAEIYANGVSGDNTTIFGYQGRYNEMRSKKSMTCGLFHYGVSGSLAFWHLGRHFSTAPALNATFLKCIPRKDYLAAPSQPACIVNVANIIKAVRPMPIEPEPGLIDHA